MSPTDKIPPTIAATVAAFRANAPTQWRENETVMKFAMKFFETGVLAGVGLIYDIEMLPKAERDVATENLKVEFDRIVLASILKRLASLFGGEESEAKGPRRETAHIFGVDRGQGDFTATFTPADSPDGTPESKVYENLLAKIAKTENEEGGKENG